jgi:hypothetical protein
MFQWNTMPSSLYLKKKVLCSFETSGNPNPATKCYILKDLNLNNSTVETTSNLAKVHNFV